MAWIELHQSLFTHRKTLALADSLNLPEVYVVGHLTALWTWGLDNAQDGVLPQSERIIARAAQWAGDPCVLVEALVEVGYLDAFEDGTLHIHDWEMYAGRLIDKRKANADRMREARNRNKPDTKQEHATHVQRTSSARAGATVPNPTVQNSTNTPPTPPGGGDAVALFEEWFERELWPAIPDRGEGKIGKGKTKDYVRQHIPAKDRPLVLKAVRNLAASGRLPPDPIRLFKSREYPNGFWREWVETPIGASQNGPHKQGNNGSGARPAQTGEPNSADKKRIEGLRSLVARKPSGPDTS